jgi:murein DD-endopeptidase MepM/ murein hydrolase activator NlpD
MSKAILVENEDPINFSVEYQTASDETEKAFLASQWNKFNQFDPALGKTYKIWCRLTSPNTQITIDHLVPLNSIAGRYRIETFVPNKHSNTKKAMFHITTGFHEQGDTIYEEKSLVLVDMTELHNVWQPLGEYYLDPKSFRNSGKVRQFSLSLENPPAEASFGPVRWVPLFTLPGDGPTFDSPVGTKPERNAPFPTGRVAFGKYPIWAGFWFDVNPYLSWYEYGYHTGADLNLPGASGADMGKDIYASGDGIVTYAGAAGTWGNIVVIEHANGRVTLPNGNTSRQKVYTRYGHVDLASDVKTGREVERGQLIAYIGLARGATAGWHLHFDICFTDLLHTRPAHWPNIDTIQRLRWSSADPDSNSYKSAQAAIMREVINNYLDPLRFIQDNH